MSTIFIAVQCCQCSTMQVKQQKKSKGVNKWTCVVCNQKQSVVKVFSQGFMAKDLRNFVQTFNMSRSFSHSNQQQNHQIPNEDYHSHSQRKTRIDWTHYLDFDSQDNRILQQTEAGEDDFEPKIVTELTKEMVKMPKLNNSPTKKVDAGEADELYNYKPVYSNTFTSTTTISHDKEARRYNKPKTLLMSMAKGGGGGGSSKWGGDDEPKRKCQRTISSTTATAKGVSKWNDYITKDNNDDDLQLGSRGNFEHQIANVLDLEYDDETVEDHVHPDFI